ncbi:MAG: sodium-translocating pyrophosphatase [Candidatus Aenigmarchaeota archaeon]|nr:sodium-translocating pyrophosphatase [Candidatus Aenigmarchaeota archaeon]
METFFIVPISGIIGIIFSLILIKNIFKKDEGTEKMKEIGKTIFEAAMAYLKRQYKTIAIVALITSILIGLATGYNNVEMGMKTAISFLLGALCSGASGFIGMYVSVKSNVRCASAARRSLNEAIQVAIRGGAVSGFLIVSLCLLGISGIFFAYNGLERPNIVPYEIVGFSFGASFVAIFALLGGGIYTKAADMGADLVGKVEKGIPEDDPRNAAVIADLVGDNVGDCAGRGADLFESTAAAIIGGMVLGIAMYSISKDINWIIYPLLIISIGLIASIVGILSVRGNEDENPILALNRGYYITILISLIGIYIITTTLLGKVIYFFATLVGIATSIVFVYITRYYTEAKFRPVKSIAEASKTGAATNILTGISVAFECIFPTVITISAALLISYWLGSLEGSGLYGTALAAIGMLTSCAYLLAMDTFGPISDNANGIIEMSGEEKARKRTEGLDAVGNTTKALTKGYAIGSAALAAFVLFSAYISKVREIRGLGIDVNILQPDVFVASLIAGALVFLFSALGFRAVGKTASKIIEEVRRQFKENPLIMKGKAKPDYKKVVDIATKAGLKEMTTPSILAISTPILLGIIFKLLGFNAAEAVGGFLIVGTITGILVGTFMNNGGGAWDNAKKYIEAGGLKDEEGKTITKGTPTHAAAVVGDTVGDPFKDTVGPSLNVLIKIISTSTLILCVLFL